MEKKCFAELTARTFERYHLPFIRQFISFNAIKNVLVIGGEELTCFQSLSKNGCSINGVNVEKLLAPHFLENSIEKEIKIGDKKKGGEEQNQLFDLIVINELILQVEEKKSLIERAMKLLQPNGIIFVSFRPWHRPFSGCRDFSRSKFLSSIPFIHLLPQRFYRFILNYFFKEDPFMINTLLQVKNHPISIETFRTFFSDKEYLIKAEKLYAVDPMICMKYNFEPFELADLIRRIPYLRNILSACCSYVITKNIYHVQII